jgi:mono/diheme cytochrome c family protein
MEVGRMISKFPGNHQWLSVPIMVVISVFTVYLAGCSSRYNAAALDGQSIFVANCNACHTIGGGNLAGPDLKGVTEQQSQEWLVNFISNPDGVITSGDPTAKKLLRENNYVVMPNMGLTTQQILAVLNYIKAESSLTVRPTPIATQGINLPQGNAANGEAIFLGYSPLKNGAPFCIGCHRIDDTGLLGGGTLGPDLSNAYTVYGEAGLDGILSNLPFLTMRPIYANNSFTDQEKADLLAFMKSVAGEPTVDKEPVIIGISLAGFLVIMLAFAIVWRNRIRSVRKQLVEHALGRAPERKGRVTL